jgi:hypothetical protein
LVEGPYKSPVGVFGFNPFEGWSRDVSDVAHEIRKRWDLLDRDLPAPLEEFVERHEGSRHLSFTQCLSSEAVMSDLDDWEFEDDEDAKTTITAAVRYLLKGAAGSDRGDIS